MSTRHLESFAKYAGIATVCIEWLSLLFYYINMPAYFGNKYPISYFATLPETKLIFSIAYLLAGLFFWIFIRHHLSKYYQIPIKVFGLSMLFFIALALIPFNPLDPLSNTIHVTAAYLSGVFFAVGMYLFAKGTKNKSIYRVTFIALILSTLLLFGFAASPKESTLIFGFEAGSWLVVQLWILWISYYSYSKKKNS